MTTPEQEQLKQAYARYEQAQGKVDREVVTARLALCLALVHTGWSPPESVQEQMRRDQKTLGRLRDVHVVDLSDVLRLPGHRPVAVIPALTPPQ